MEGLCKLLMSRTDRVLARHRFDTNYHYIVPEFRPGQEFSVESNKPVEEFREAKSLGISTRPVLLGPVSFLLLGKMESGRSAAQLKLLEGVLPVYEEVLKLLQKAGADWVQIDEPCLVLDLPEEAHPAFHTAYQRLNAIGLPLLVATYFGGLRDNEPKESWDAASGALCGNDPVSSKETA